MTLAEKEAQCQNLHVGLGVGLYADYGSAQRLYFKRGYISDGNGITYRYHPVQPGEEVRVDDELVLWLVTMKSAEGISR